MAKLQNEDYLNWLRGSLSLLFVKEGIEAFTDRRVVDFHERLKEDVSQQPEPYASVCNTCTHQDIERHNHTWRVRCKSKLCNTWLKQILRYHAHGKNPTIACTNLKPHLWPTEPWEVAKFFLPRGSENITEAKDADIAAIMKFMTSCMFMYLFTDRSLVQEVLDVRHRLMHSNNMAISDDELKRDTDNMIKFLESLVDLTQGETDKVKETIDNICKLRHKAIDVTLNREVVVLTSKMLAVEAELYSLGVKYNDLDKVSHDLTTTADGLQSFETDYRQSKAEMDQLQVIIDKLDELKNNLTLSGVSTTLQEHSQMLVIQDQRLSALEQMEKLQVIIDKLDELKNNLTSSGVSTTLQEHSQMLVIQGQRLSALEQKKQVTTEMPCARTGAFDTVATTTGSSDRPVEETHISTEKGGPSQEGKTQYMDFTNKDGRICDIPLSKIESLMKMSRKLGEGGFGTTHLVDKIHRYQRIVIKKICCKDSQDNRISAINEMLASRLKHQGLVPLLGMTWDIVHEIFYFVMPYMENGDLNDALKRDRDRFEREDVLGPILSYQIRFKIIFQLATVIQFLHKSVPKFRGIYVHGDITTKNIVLDAKFNMRLLDFGLSREMKAHKSGTTMKPSTARGTLGYICKNSNRLSAHTDVFSFGVVVLELLTSQPPVLKYGKCLHHEDDIMSEFYQEIRHVWGQDQDVVRKLVDIADKCQHQSTTAEHIIKELKHCCRSDRYHQVLENDPKCNLCMINRTVKNAVLKHQCDVHLCVPCLRTSYLNPIKCPFCEEDLQSPIGNSWGAILFAGNDTKRTELADSFRADIEKVRRTITSKRQLSMGINDEDVKIIQASQAGTPDKLIDNLKPVVQYFNQRDSISALMVYFIGHKNESNQLVFGDTNETLPENDIHSILQDLLGKHKLFLILDCCCPNQKPDYQTDTKLKSGLLMLTCSRSEEDALASVARGSLFTSHFIQCFSGETASDECIQNDCSVCKNDQMRQKCCDGFITIDYINDYIGRHMESVGCELPSCIQSTKEWRDTRVAFYMPKLQPLELVHEYAGIRMCQKLDKIPEAMTDMFSQMYHFATSNDILQAGKVQMKYFKDIFAVILQTGRILHDKKELETLEQIESAMNGLCKIYVMPRTIELIHFKKAVGILTDDAAIETDLIVRYIKQQWDVTLNETKSTTVLKIDIPLNSLRFKPNTSHAEVKKSRSIHQFLKAKIFDFLVSEQFEVKDGKLVMTFPYKNASEELEKHFFIVHIESNDSTTTSLSSNGV